MSTRTFFVVNPSAAGGRLARRWPRLQRRLRRRLGPFDHALTAAAGDATRLARAAARAGYRLIVSVGGDGTHGEVINGLIEDDAAVAAELTLGLLPFGTGGDFRRMLHGPATLRDDIDRLADDAHDLPIDVGRVDFRDDDGEARMRYFLNIGGFGIGALVDRYVNQSSKRFGGRLSFLSGTLKATLRYRPPTVEVQLDDGPWRAHRVHHTAIANGQFFGGGMRIAPRARLDSGAFSVVTVEPPVWWRALPTLSAIYRGEHLDRSGVHHDDARVVRARSDQTVWLEIDGEAPGTLPATFRVVPQALRLRRGAP